MGHITILQIPFIGMNVLCMWRCTITRRAPPPPPSARYAMVMVAERIWIVQCTRMNGFRARQQNNSAISTHLCFAYTEEIVFNIILFLFFLCCCMLFSCMVSTLAFALRQTIFTLHVSDGACVSCELCACVRPLHCFVSFIFIVFFLFLPSYAPLLPSIQSYLDPVTNINAIFAPFAHSHSFISVADFTLSQMHGAWTHRAPVVAQYKQ